MELVLLVTAILTFAIFLTVFISLIKEIKTTSFSKKEVPLIILSLGYLIFTVIIVLWIVKFLSFEVSDFIIVLSTILTIQTICILALIYKIRNNKKILYTLIPLFILVPISIFAPQLIHLIIPASFLVTLIVFLSSADIHGKATKFLILYTSASTFIYLFAILWTKLMPLLGLISSALFLIFLISFLNLLKQQANNQMLPNKTPESPLIHFLKHLVFIVIITNFIFIGTISIHELGHLLASSQSSCEESKIVYELEGLPHTEIDCQNTPEKIKWILGGVLSPILIAILLFFGGGKFVKELSLQIVGFNLIISYMDMMSLGFSKTIALFISILGITLSVLSIALLIKSRVE